MGSYRIFETSVFREDLDPLPERIRAKIEKKLSDYVYPWLRQQPHFGPNIRKLMSWKPETWRYRIGPWRLFYEINEADKMVYLVALDNRRDAY